MTTSRSWFRPTESEHGSPCIGRSPRLRSSRASISISLSTAPPSSRRRSTGLSGSVQLECPGTTPPILTSWCWLTPKATVSASSIRGDGVIQFEDWEDTGEEYLKFELGEDVPAAV